MKQRNSTTSRIERLDLVTARLKSDDALTVGSIARELNVSVRTLSRDIQILKDKGLPIETDVGRGGGIRLDRHWGVGRIKLNYTEAVDLLISLAVAEQMQSPLFMAHLTTIRHKLMATFSPDMKHKVRGLKNRILIGKSSSVFVLEKFIQPTANVSEKIHQSFLTQTKLDISYASESGSRTKRTIEPHYLLLNYPVWYLISWDNLREQARTFRCDRIKRIRVLDDGFDLKGVEDFKSSLEGVDVI